MRVFTVSGSVSNPSRTAGLVKALANQIAALFAVDLAHVELSTAAPVPFRALRADQLGAEGRAIIDVDFIGHRLNSAAVQTRIERAVEELVDVLPSAVRHPLPILTSTIATHA